MVPTPGVRLIGSASEHASETPLPLRPLYAVISGPLTEPALAEPGRGQPSPENPATSRPLPPQATTEPGAQREEERERERGKERGLNGW